MFEFISNSDPRSFILTEACSCRLELAYFAGIVLFARADWLARRCLAKHYSPPSSRRKTKWLLSVYCHKVTLWPLVIMLVWYILKQLFTSVSVKVVDINLATSPLGKYPPPFTSTSVSNCRCIGYYSYGLLTLIKYSGHV